MSAKRKHESETGVSVGRAPTAVRSAPRTGRSQRVFETLSEVLELPYDVVSIIVAYDSECAVMFVDASGDMTVWSLNENQSATTKFCDPAKRTTNNSHTISEAHKTEFFTFLACSPVTADQSSPGVNLFGKVNFCSPRRLRLFRALDPTTPLRYEEVSAVRTGEDGVDDAEFWGDGYTIQMCCLPRQRVLVATPVYRPSFVGHIWEFAVIDYSRGGYACDDLLTVRSSRPESFEQSNGSLSGGLRRLHELTIEILNLSAPSDEDSIRLQAEADALKRSLALFPNPPASLNVKLKASVTTPTDRLLPFPAPYEHVIFWIGYNPQTERTQYGVYDTDRCCELIDPPRSADSIPVSTLGWLIFPATPSTVRAATATADADASAADTDFIRLALVIGAEADLPIVFFISSDHVLPLPARAGSTFVPAPAALALHIQNWCDDASIDIAPSGLEAGNKTTPMAMYADGSGRIVFACTNGSLAIVTSHISRMRPRAEHRNVRVDTRFLRPAKGSAVPDRMQFACLLDGDRIATASDTQIWIWDLTTECGDDAANRMCVVMELIRPADSRTKIRHFMALSGDSRIASQSIKFL